MRQMVLRDNRVADVNILRNLLQGVSFFASTTILIIGGLLAVLSTTEQASAIVQEIPFAARTSVLVFDLKIVLMLAIASPWFIAIQLATDGGFVRDAVVPGVAVGLAAVEGGGAGDEQHRHEHRDLHADTSTSDWLAIARIAPSVV